MRKKSYGQEGNRLSTNGAKYAVTESTGCGAREERALHYGGKAQVGLQIPRRLQSQRIRERLRHTERRHMEAEEQRIGDATPQRPSIVDGHEAVPVAAAAATTELLVQPSLEIEEAGAL